LERRSGSNDSPMVWAFSLVGFLIVVLQDIIGDKADALLSPRSWKSSRLHLIIGSRSDRIRLIEPFKPDCTSTLQRKSLQRVLVTLNRTLSPVRFESNKSRITPISREC
jgi:hypothetical protein